MQLIRVLLIDDDRNYYSLIQKMLAREPHYHVDWVSTYETAKTVAQKTRHDVYLVDYRLGDHTGLDLLAEFQRMNIDTPFIIMTSYADREFDLHVLDAGAADYIDKADLKPSILTRTIRYAVQRAADRKALLKSEEKYRTLLEDASDGILILSIPQGRVLIANSTAANMVGLPVEILIGREAKEFIQPPSGSKLRFSPNTLPEGETVLIEQVIVRPDGSRLPVELSAKLASEGNVQCLIRDITHRKQVEAEREKYIQRLTILRQIDEEITQTLDIDYVLALALDAAVRLSMANAGFIATVDNGRLRVEQAIGYYSQIRAGEHLPPNPLFEQVITTQQSVFLPDVSQYPGYVQTTGDTVSHMIIALNSYERTLGFLNLETKRADRFNPEMFEFIQLIGARIAVALENAQLYQIAQDQLARLQELYRQVSELEQLKSDMIHIAAHDLRNPVGVIVGYLELLEWSLGDQLTERQRAQFEAMMRAAQRMARITTDILSLERIEQLHLDRSQRIVLGDVVREAFDEYREQAQQKNQTMTLDLTHEKLVIQADYAQILEAASNLIGNAIKYTPPGGTVDVSLKAQDGYGVFQVVDTGYGIPEDQQVSLFQPFFRASSDETASIEGTGLGLHLVKNIITRHDGEMIFQSVYGKGSTFGFRLPLMDENETETSTADAVGE